MMISKYNILREEILYERIMCLIMPQFTLPHQKAECITYIENSEEKKIVSIEKYTRSKEQNAKWHAHLDEMAKASWYTPDEMKAILKQSITNAWLLKMVETKETAKGMPYTLERKSSELKENEMSTLIQYTIDMQYAQQEKLKEFATDLFSN